MRISIDIDLFFVGYTENFKATKEASQVSSFPKRDHPAHQHKKFLRFFCGSFCLGPGLYLSITRVADPWHLDPGVAKTWGSYGSGSGTLVHLHHSSKIKSHKEVTKQQKSRFFLLFFCLMMQCCGSGSGSVRIRNFWPDPDPIRNRNKHFGSGFGSGFRIRFRIRISDPVSDPDFESGFESGSEINKKKELYIQAKIRWFHRIIHISHLHVVVHYVYACAAGLVGHWKQLLYRKDIYVPDRRFTGKLDRVLGFFSSRPNWDSLTRRWVCSPLLWFRGDTHSLRERGWGGPNSDEGTDTGMGEGHYTQTICIYVCVRSS